MGGAEVPLHHLLRGCEAAIIVVGDPPREELPNHFGVEESGFPITVRRLGPGGDVSRHDRGHSTGVRLSDLPVERPVLFAKLLCSRGI